VKCQGILHCLESSRPVSIFGLMKANGGYRQLNGNGGYRQQTIAAYRQIYSPSFCMRVGKHMALFYIHQINQVNSCNDIVMETAASTFPWYYNCYYYYYY